MACFLRVLLSFKLFLLACVCGYQPTYLVHRRTKAKATLPFYSPRGIGADLQSSRKPFSNFQERTNGILKILTQNPISQSISTVYSFFYWFPRENLLYDKPWVLFENSTVEWIRWYQIPHNLPPYRFLGQYHPDDFFCFGLVGNTLPMGNWDPWGLQQVSPKVVRRYRESELKHGRLAMLASVGILMQEVSHPLHDRVGGLAVTQMDQLLHIATEQSIIYRMLLQPLVEALGIPVADIPQIPLDYLAVILVLVGVEAQALRRNWTRWRRDEYHHPFEHNIGIANLKEEYENGNYGFDPLQLLPANATAAQRRHMQECEINHGRLAMLAAAGMIVSEYATGLPVWSALDQWIAGTLDPGVAFSGTASGIIAFGADGSSSSGGGISGDFIGGVGIGGEGGSGMSGVNSGVGTSGDASAAGIADSAQTMLNALRDGAADLFSPNSKDSLSPNAPIQ